MFFGILFHLSASGIKVMAFSYGMAFRLRPRAEAFRPVQWLARMCFTAHAMWPFFSFGIASFGNRLFSSKS